MKFDVVIGNPPFNEEIEGTSDKQLYNYFIDEAAKIGEKFCLITKGAFLFNAGGTPKSWNKKILNDEHLKVVFYESKSANIFTGTGFKGGVAVTYRDSQKKIGPIGTFTMFHELNSILKKVLYQNEKFENILNIIHLQNKFNLKEMYKDFPEYVDLIGSNGTERRLTTKIFEQIPLFADSLEIKKDIENVNILGLIENKRVERFIPKKYLSNNSNLESFKVVLPKSNGTGKFGETLSSPTVIGPGKGFTQTFISFGAFENQSEALNCLKYLKTKFCRAMLGTLKITQDNNTDSWKNVPLQDFTSNSDIDWTKSIAEIDQQLYKKYGLNEDEVTFIESNVKEME